MKQYKLVNAKSMENMARCFSSSDELATFINHLEGCSTEVQFMAEFRSRISDDEAVYVILREMCVMAVFFREHLDLIHQLVQCIESKDITEEEFNKLKD
jgi:hypothetical protein